MNLFIVFLLKICLFWGANTAPIDPSKGACVQWLTPREYDFGDMRQNVPGHCVFSFKNTGNAPIMLQTVRTTCGCTAAKWSEGAIPPNGEGFVTVEYDAYKTGSFKKKIRVFFDCQRKPEILRIRGSVE